MKKVSNTYFDHSCGVIDGHSHITSSQIKLVKSGKEKINHEGCYEQVHSNTTRSYSEKYPYMSLLISNRSDLEKIKSKLDENGVDCSIEIRFDRYHFMPARNTAIIYHKDEFKSLREKVTKDPKFFFFNGKPSIMIKVTNIVKIQGKTELEVKENVKMYEEWLHDEFPREDLNIYKMDREDRGEFYLETKDKLAALFMYFRMVHNRHKAQFWQGHEESLREFVVKGRLTSSKMKI